MDNDKNQSWITKSLPSEKFNQKTPTIELNSDIRIFYFSITKLSSGSLDFLSHLLHPSFNFEIDPLHNSKAWFCRESKEKWVNKYKDLSHG